MNKLKKCLICNKTFDRPLRSPNYPFKISWYAYKKRKFCSKKCKNKYQSQILKGDKNSQWKGGKKRFKCIDCGENICREGRRCRNCWKIFKKTHFIRMKEEVGYTYLHKAIEREYGIPKQCEKCGKKISYTGKKVKHRNIHWANKSGEYRRDRDDWIGLCVSCHRKYDKGQISI